MEVMVITMTIAITTRIIDEISLAIKIAAKASLLREEERRPSATRIPSRDPKNLAMSLIM